MVIAMNGSVIAKMFNNAHQIVTIVHQLHVILGSIMRMPRAFADLSALHPLR